MLKFLLLVLGGALLVLGIESGLVVHVVVELLGLSLLGSLFSGLLPVGLSSGRSLLLADVTILLLTSISDGGISSGLVERRSLGLSAVGVRILISDRGSVHVVLVELDKFHLEVVAIGLSGVLEHESGGATSGLDLVGADITLVHLGDGEVLSNIDVVGEVDLLL